MTNKAQSNTNKTPIDLALKAVHDLFSLECQPPKAYTDDSSSQLENLAGELKEASQTPVLIRMGTKDSKRIQPYSDLLGELLKEHYFGVSGSIHSIVADLIEYGKEKQDDSKLAKKKKAQEGLEQVSLNNLTVSDPKIKRLEGTDPQQAKDDFKDASQNLLNWAKIESFVTSPTTSFSLLAGGLRPKVYVFDDYFNFIENLSESEEEQAIYKIKSKYEDVIRKIEKEAQDDDKCREFKEIQKYYNSASSSQTTKLGKALEGFYVCLNRLSLAFDVKKPDMEFPETEFQGVPDNLYEEVARILKFSILDRERSQIAAFIIDLEWLPYPEWIVANAKNIPGTNLKSEDREHMGHIAVRLLTQRYPEIPCFIFTGMWSIETLQQSLAVGAAWCFQKSISHHLGGSSSPTEELDYNNLEYHLTEFAKRSYGSYPQLPKTNQFNTESNSRVTSELEKRIKEKDIEVNFSDDKCIHAQSFRGLISKQFISEEVEPIKVLTAGLSGALATFFIRGVDKKKSNATRFMKIDNWLDVQKEYFSYQNIIRPTLNNHVAHIIQPPAVTPARIGNELYPLHGAIVSSLAGFPEDYNKLRSLEQLIDEYLDEGSSGATLLHRLEATLNYLLLPMYKNATKREFSSTEHLLALYTGKIISINDQQYDLGLESIDLDRDEQISNHSENPVELLNCCLDRAWFKDRKLSLKSLSSGTKVELSFPKTEDDKASIQETLERRFSSLWTRLGMKVKLVVILDKENKNISDYRDSVLSGSKCESIDSLLQKWKDATKYPDAKDSFAIMTYKFKFTGLSGTIHGDLNLNNILYPEGEQVGFLIDFPKAQTDGLIAFDLAWLEVRIWRSYIIPNIISLANSLSLHDFEVISFEILSFALRASDFVGDSPKLFKSLVRKDPKYGYIDGDLLNPVANGLIITSTIRRFAREKLSIFLSSEENQLWYGLGVAFLNNCKYKIQPRNYFDIPEKINTLSYLASSYYLSSLMQKHPKPQSQDSDKTGDL